MKSRQEVQADELAKFAERLLVSIFRPDIIAGGKGMLRIEADSQPVALFRRVDHVADLLKAIAEVASLTRGDLQRDFNIKSGTGRMDLIERAADRLDPFLFSRTHVGSGMRDEMGDRKNLAPFH